MCAAGDRILQRLRNNLTDFGSEQVVQYLKVSLVKGAAKTSTTTIQNVSVNHRSFYILVPH